MFIHGHAALLMHALHALGVQEQRKHPRQRTLKTGRVILHGTTTIDCVIRDLSRDGARLVFGAPTELDESFDLLVLTAHSLIHVTLIWQRGLAAGVAFTDLAQPATPYEADSTEAPVASFDEKIGTAGWARTTDPRIHN